MNTLYKIYSLPKNYKVLEIDFPKCCFEGTIDEVFEKLKENNGWHIRINPDNKCIAFGDFDHTTQEEFNKFLNLICKEFSCTLNEISYTESKKSEIEYSYHWSIPSIETTPTILLSEFKRNIYDEYENKLDKNVYHSLFLRLPNQTNKIKKLEHKIINGTMKDFIIEYIENAEYDFISSNTSTPAINEDKKIVSTEIKLS